MREIKFRVWSKPSNKMYQQLNESPCFGLFEGDRAVSIEDVFFYEKQDFEVMQYTGFEGTYEGDILYGEESDEYGSIYSRWYGLVYWDEELCGFYVKDDLGEIYRLDDFDYDRIAGNIYENPELLEAVE